MDIKQTFVLYNQNYYFKNTSDQNPELSESTTTMTSSNKTNNIYNISNNVNNLLYQKHSKKMTQLPQKSQIIQDPFKTKHINPCKACPKIYTKSIVKNEKNPTYYNRSMSTALMEQNKSSALIKNKLKNNKSQLFLYQNNILNNNLENNNTVIHSNNKKIPNNNIKNYLTKPETESTKQNYEKKNNYGSMTPYMRANSEKIQNNNKIIKGNNNGYVSENETKIEKSAILNVEEFLMIEGKLSDVIKSIENYNSCEEESFEWLNFYSNTSLSKNINKYFLKPEFIQVINRGVNLLVFSLIISYNMSLDEDIFNDYKNIIIELMNLSHSIIILLSKYFCNKIIENSFNIWVERLEKLTEKYDPYSKTGIQIIKEIENVCNIFLEKIYELLNQYQNKTLIDIYNQIDYIKVNELIKTYREKIHRNLNQNGSIIASSSYFQKNKTINNNISIPYLKNKSNKLYTLVLDLDETLIHFKVNPNDETSGRLQFRPYLCDFLKIVKKYYELIVFTAATQDYADPIINAIEDKGTKFDYRLYRIHTVVIDNDFVKDLSRLGRDLSKTIIVDNMEQNYKLQKNNGICIRPFWGKDTEDTALFDLIDVLKKIAEFKMDVREGILMFKEDIISKVSSDIFRRAQK